MTVAVPSAARADRLVELLRERELDSLLVTNLVNVRYLAGFTGSNAVCLVAPDRRVFFTDFRYVSQAEEQVRDFERLPAGRELATDLAKHLRGRAGFDDEHVTVRVHHRLAEELPEGVELVAAGGLVEQLREVKEEGELERIREAARLATLALERTLENGLSGRTEAEVSRELQQAMRHLGAEDPSFSAIVAAGPHGALPHAEPRDVQIPTDTLVVIDWGARLDGYCSDCTRTIATGPLGPEAEAVYELVRRAQDEALAAVRAGAEKQGVDGVARAIIEEAGQGERFGHGLGHGVGLEVHEGPRLTKQAEGALAAGNVVTVEPGVYIPGELGVRIEDLVAVTEDGSEVFTTFSKQLTTVD